MMRLPYTIIYPQIKLGWVQVLRRLEVGWEKHAACGGRRFSGNSAEHPGRHFWELRVNGGVVTVIVLESSQFHAQGCGETARFR